MRIGLLGMLAVQDEAGRAVRVAGHRVRLLLILLALDAGRVVPTYSLIENLWEDEPPANAANSLQSLVSRLRMALREAGLGDQVIESHPAGYRLAIAPSDVDVLAFEALAKTGNQALAAGDPATARRDLRAALDLWRGPALADAAGARFASGPAARLGELRTGATLDLIEADLAAGDSDSLVGELRAIIAADPVAERPRALLMRALYAAGRQAEALAVYGETRDLLATELGVDPSAQLEQVYLGVLRQDLPDGQPSQPAPEGTAAAGADHCAADPERLAGADLAAPRLPGVRKPLTSFVGRDEDVKRVLKMLAEGRLVTLTGPGGAGKTRLAVEIASRLAEDSPALPAGTAAAADDDAARAGGTVWLIELARVSDPGEVPYAVLNTLGIRESPVLARAGTGQLGVLADPVERLVAALAQRRGLLILDNCEHLVAAAAEVADQVLAECPGVRVLVTSREPLRITGEALWPVAPLPVPPALAPGPDGQAGDLSMPGQDPGRAKPPARDDGGPVAGYAAVRLLADRAAAVRPGFRVDADNAADVARICRALDGMPLAIELAAARLRILSTAQLAERLDARFELLTGGSRTAGPRHRTLRAVVDWSWELLSEPEQVLARRLAVFPGGVTLPAAEQVCQDAALPAQAILPTIFGLVEKSFLTVAEDGEPRYRMLETIRAYCAERLAEVGEQDRVRQAFATYFRQLAETADPLLRGAEQHIWMRRLHEEQDNVHAALRWAIDRRDAAVALRFGQALAWFWLLRGQRRETSAMARGILAISDPAEFADPADPGLDVVQARAVCALTALNANWDLSDTRQPLADARRLIAAEPGVAGHAGRPLHPLVVVGLSIFVLYEERDPDQALQLIAAHFESADPWTRSGARLMHAFTSMNLGRLREVARDCAEAFGGFQTIGDRWGMALALVGQGELAMLDGDYARAIEALERSLELIRQLADSEDTAQAYATLAKSRSRLGDYDGALADLARAERIASEQGESESDLWIGYVRAELAWLRGDIAESGRICQWLDDRLATKDMAMVWSYRAQVRNRGALADIRTGATRAGCAGLAEALRIAQQGLEPSGVAVVLDGLAAAALWTGDGRGAAAQAAVLLGAAHSIRGAFDHSSLDAPAARDAGREALGAAAFEAAYQRGRDLSYEDAMALAEQVAAALVEGAPESSTSE